MGAQKTGDWEKARAAMLGMETIINQGTDQGMRQIGLKGEAIAKKHVSAQDLPWRALKPATIAAKIRKGENLGILIATSTYFSTITSWYQLGRRRTLIGVSKEATHTDADGNIVKTADIAATLEYGTKDGATPARPLWQPTKKELMAWVKTSNPIKRAVNERLNKLKK